MKKCPHCRQYYEDTQFDFCIGCGTALENINAMPPSSTPSTPPTFFNSPTSTEPRKTAMGLSEKIIMWILILFFISLFLANMEYRQKARVVSPAYIPRHIYNQDRAEMDRMQAEIEHQQREMDDMKRKERTNRVLRSQGYPELL